MCDGVFLLNMSFIEAFDTRRMGSILFHIQLPLCYEVSLAKRKIWSYTSYEGLIVAKQKSQKLQGI